MKRAVTFVLLLFFLLGWLSVFPARAVTTLQTAPKPTPTRKACHICDEGLPLPVVHAVLFWMEGCPHCHEALNRILPPLQEKYDAQLEILLVEVITLEDVNRLYEAAAVYDIPRERVGVPFLIIGEQVLIGSSQISDKLPGLIEHYLTQGGVDWPLIPKLNDFLSQAAPTPLPVPTIREATVRAILFTTLDCRDCQLVTAQTLGPLREQYGNQFEVQTVDVATPADVEYLYQVAAGYGIPAVAVGLPLLIIGDRVLMGEEILTKLPDLVQKYILAGSVEIPSLPPRPGETATPVSVTSSSSAPAPSTIHSNGFTLAIVTIALMAAALIYSIVAFAIGKTFRLPAWGDWLIPALIITGIGVAGYLSYVETQSVEAVCGPIGDCNAVQQSRYAKLFDALPVSMLGLFGYLALSAAWLGGRLIPKLERPAAISFWVMAFFAVIFSLYLTYIEPFVINAVCIWCLTSAVAVTLLLLLGTPPAVNQFVGPEED